ncbi:unnamed protein product [Heligmosomoides polygyrus]|uniref:Membrane lipoprotein n=1 Tax=Heligmosomoides polygyrus TaxID=6339 RepID=A0A183G0V0_HELPZ|nr:unnamed protein product [Heligmosomoides polygyrus]
MVEFRMSSTATQRSLLLALSGVSLAAFFIWYLQSKKGRGARRSLSAEDVKRSNAVENADVTADITPTRRRTLTACDVSALKHGRGLGDA